MNERGYTTNVGDYLIVWITGCLDNYIAEVVRPDPLQLKIEESGPYACLKEDDFFVLMTGSEQFQKDLLEKTNIFLESEHQARRKVISGLKSLGITDGRLHEIPPEIQQTGPNSDYSEDDQDIELPPVPHDCSHTEKSRPFCHICGKLIGGF